MSIRANQGVKTLQNHVEAAASLHQVHSVRQSNLILALHIINKHIWFFSITLRHNYKEHGGVSTRIKIMGHTPGIFETPCPKLHVLQSLFTGEISK